MGRKVGVGVVAGLLLIGLAGCGGGTGAITDHIELSAYRVSSGQSFKATFILDNPRKAINLTKVSKEEFYGPGHKPVYCRPWFTIILVSPKARQNVIVAASCSSAPYIIAHGMTRLHSTVNTYYSECTGGRPSALIPACIANNPPPLPSGKYTTQLVWSETVPLPKPAPLTVVIVKTP